MIKYDHCKPPFSTDNRSMDASQDFGINSTMLSPPHTPPPPSSQGVLHMKFSGPQCATSAAVHHTDLDAVETLLAISRQSPRNLQNAPTCNEDYINRRIPSPTPPPSVSSRTPPPTSDSEWEESLVEPPSKRPRHDSELARLLLARSPPRTPSPTLTAMPVSVIVRASSFSASSSLNKPKSRAVEALQPSSIKTVGDNAVIPRPSSAPSSSIHISSSSDVANASDEASQHRKRSQSSCIASVPSPVIVQNQRTTCLSQTPQASTTESASTFSYHPYTCLDLLQRATLQSEIPQSVTPPPTQQPQPSSQVTNISCASSLRTNIISHHDVPPPSSSPSSSSLDSSHPGKSPSEQQHYNNHHHHNHQPSGNNLNIVPKTNSTSNNSAKPSQIIPVVPVTIAGPISSPLRPSDQSPQTLFVTQMPASTIIPINNLGQAPVMHFVWTTTNPPLGSVAALCGNSAGGSSSGIVDSKDIGNGSKLRPLCPAPVVVPESQTPKDPKAGDTRRQIGRAHV